MQLCDQCPNNPLCEVCLQLLGAGPVAQKVIPPRVIALTHIASGKRIEATLLAISRISIGIKTEGDWASGRYEVELATDFLIIASTVSGIRDTSYHVLDIEQVLRKEEIFDRLMIEEFHSWHLTAEIEPAHLLNHPLSEKVKQEMIKRELEKLTILRQINDIYMFVWERNRLRPLGAVPFKGWEELAIQPLINSALAAGRGIREQLVSEEMDLVFDVHVMPLPDRSCGVAMINITEAIAFERERLRKEWELYSSIMAVVTNGKLTMLDDVGLYELIKRDTKLLSLTVKNSGDLALMRLQIKKHLHGYKINQPRLLHFLTAVNEAASNALIYGSMGMIDVYLTENRETFRIVVYDAGEGISLEDLPKAALIHGYSTRKSLGAGFPLMLQYSDKLWLNSSRFGTKIVLDLHVLPDEGR